MFGSQEMLGSDGSAPARGSLGTVAIGNVISLTLEAHGCHAADMQRARLTFADDNGLLPPLADRATNKK
jgi:hypothetical protein